MINTAVESEALRGEGPQELHTRALAEIHKQMENGDGESGDENGKRRNLFLRWPASAQEKRESDKQAEQQSCRQRMTIGAIEGEKSGGASKFAEQVDIGDCSRDEHGNGDGGSEAGKSSTLQGVGGQGMGEKIHG